MSEPRTISKKDLLTLIWTRPVSDLANEFGMSPNGLAKICDRLDIERPPRGHWRKLGREGVEIIIPDLIGENEVVTIGGGQSVARRPRSRMTPEDRKKQILEEARRTAMEAGLTEVTLRNLAKSLGISEAQAHNCFSTREDLLVELAMEEVYAFEASRLRAISRGNDRVTKVIMSSLNYLREVSRRGPLLYRLLRNSGVRVRVDAERDSFRSKARGQHIVAIRREKDFDQDEALASLSVITAMLVRAGTMVSEDRLTMEEAERISIPIVVAAALERQPQA